MADPDGTLHTARVAQSATVFAISALTAGAFAWLARGDAGWPAWVVLVLVGFALALPVLWTPDRRAWVAAAISAGSAGVTVLIVFVRNDGSVSTGDRLLGRGLPPEALAAAGLLSLVVMGSAVTLAAWWRAVRTSKQNHVPGPVVPPGQVLWAAGRSALLALALVPIAWSLASVGLDTLADQHADAATRYT